MCFVLFPCLSTGQGRGGKITCMNMRQLKKHRDSQSCNLPKIRSPPVSVTIRADWTAITSRSIPGEFFFQGWEINVTKGRKGDWGAMAGPVLVDAGADRLWRLRGEVSILVDGKSRLQKRITAARRCQSLGVQIADHPISLTIPTYNALTSSPRSDLRDASTVHHLHTDDARWTAQDNLIISTWRGLEELLVCSLKQVYDDTLSTTPQHACELLDTCEPRAERCLFQSSTMKSNEMWARGMRTNQYGNDGTAKPLIRYGTCAAWSKN
ncbi:hypothetical protein ACRALDRAFT_205148 [Sodiomyces alcalophilus JCM 7366]|uniref:uncharacterized protein n=1 Tax=Sodiomyces alcalophilus JCM 7366 TaxID=591952 RepID=UPI0039B3DEA8